MKSANDEQLAEWARKTADKRNRERLIRAIAATTPTGMADFIALNFDLFEPMAAKVGIDLDEAIDALRGENAKLQRDGHKDALRVVSRHIDQQGIEGIQQGKLKYRAADPDVLIDNQRRSEVHRADVLGNAKRTAVHTKDFAMTLLKYGTALTSHTLGAAGATLKFVGKTGWHVWGMTANGWGAALGAMGFGYAARNTIAAAGIGAAALFVSMPVDATMHATVLGQTIQQADIHRVCLDNNLLSADPVSAAFAIAHGNHSADVDMIFRASLTAGLRHGVAPEALFYIADYETNGFRDLVANNSSATNPWQLIDSTKFAYIKAHGQRTDTYLLALQRLENGTSHDPNRDRMIVSSIDTVVKMSQEAIDAALKNTRFSPTQFAALTLANDINFAAELVALDIKKNAPALRLENVANMSVQQRLQLTAGYYAPDHFLGATNTRYAYNLAAKDGNARLTNTDYVASLIGASGARKLNAVVTTNPGLMPTNVTAEQLIPRITSYFSGKVNGSVTPVTATLGSARSAFELCVENPEIRQQGPVLASRAEIAYAIGSTVFGRLTGYTPAQP